MGVRVEPPTYFRRLEKLLLPFIFDIPFFKSFIIDDAKLAELVIQQQF